MFWTAGVADLVRSHRWGGGSARRGAWRRAGRGSDMGPVSPFRCLVARPDPLN